jgi:uncharacterized membrane protein
MSSKEVVSKSTDAELTNVPADVARVINSLPVQKRQIIQSFVFSKQHFGPLPDSDTIRVYSEVIPNGGDRLMNTVERQLEHRIDIEKNSVRRTFNQSSTGQWMGFGVTILFALVSWDLIRSGNTATSIAGGVLGTIDLVALVTVFITSRGGTPKQA